MSMKLAISIGSLFLLLGTTAPVYAEIGHQEKEHNQGKLAQRQQRTYGGSFYGGVQSGGFSRGGVHRSGVPQEQGQVRSGFLQSRSSSWSKDHRSWNQRGGYSSYRIPEERFRRYFGSNNFFVIYSLPIVFVGGYPRFQYDGYWVTFVDPWPAAWGPAWFQTDEVYIDYTADGYYLYNRRHPGTRIAVSISF